MYETDFGLDWESLSRRSAYERAFALGVAESLGERHADELDRILNQLDDAYDRSIVELAYEEGRTRARKKRVAESSSDEAVWSSLVDSGDDELTMVPATEAPPTMLNRVALLEIKQNDLDRIRLPKFLLDRR